MNARKRGQAAQPISDGRVPFWLNGREPGNSSLTEKAMAVFQPDILLEHQFQTTYRRRFSLDPERLLMLAVLQDAVVCFQDNLGATCKRKQVMHAEAEEWIMNRDRSYLFAFENVCEALGYDADYIRGGLLRWKRVTLARQRQSHERATSRAAAS